MSSATNDIAAFSLAATDLAHYHQLERANIQRQLIEEMHKGLADIKAGRTQDARTALNALIAKRARG